MMSGTTGPRGQFIAAVKSQNVNEVARLLERGVSPNIFVDLPNKLRALDYAKRVNNEALLALLIAYGAKNEVTVFALSSSSSAMILESREDTPREQFISAVRTKNHVALKKYLTVMHLLILI